MEKTTIDGFKLPKRELTEEEATRDITPERIREFENHVGEDFIDQYDHLFNAEIVAGFLLARHPHKATELLEWASGDHASLNDLSEIIEEDDRRLQDICDYINLTVNLKKRLNMNLIVVVEHYSSTSHT